MKILYFSQVPWNWIPQRPHFMAEHLVRQNNEVMFLALNFTKPIHLQHKRLRIQEIRALYSYTWFAPVRMLQKLWISFCLRHELPQILVLTNPIQLYLLPPHMAKLPIIYDCMDEIPQFYSGHAKSVIEKLEQDLCDTAIALTTSSQYLKEHLKQRYAIKEEKITLVRNAYEPNSLKNLPKITLKKPAAVYVGTIDHWFDFESVRQLAYAQPHLNIYLVGPRGTGCTGNVFPYPNIHEMGPLEHIQAMAYIERADIVLLPFLPKPLIAGVDPVKLYEYLALGKNIVSSHWESLKPFEQYSQLYFYKTPLDFVQAAQTALTAHSEPPPHFEQDNSWAARSAIMQQVLLAAVKQIKKEKELS